MKPGDLITVTRNGYGLFLKPKKNPSTVINLKTIVMFLEEETERPNYKWYKVLLNNKIGWVFYVAFEKLK